MTKKRTDWEQRRHRGYEAADISYSQRRYAYQSMQSYCDLRTDNIKQVLGMIKPEGSFSKVLDVGCGTGLLISQLSKSEKHFSWVGIDYSLRQLIEATERVDDDNNNTPHGFIRASAFDLPFPDNSFNAVVATRFIHQYPNELKRQLISEIRRCLIPDGLAIVEFYSFFPWLIRYPFSKGEALKDYFRHCTTRKTLKQLIGGAYSIIPLRLAGSSRLATIIGMKGVNLFQMLMTWSHIDLFFDEFLVVFGKRN